MCYFDDIIKFEDFDSDIILDEKSYENTLFYYDSFYTIYDDSYKTLIAKKPLRTSFNKIDGFISVSDGSRYLLLFGPEKCDGVYNSIRYLIRLKSGMTYVFSCNYTKIKS